MALTVNNAKWNKTQFRSNYTYKWIPGTPQVSPSISTVSNTSLTVSDGATVNTTGTFGITYMNGHTSNNTNSYSNDAKLWFKINGGSWTTIKSGGIKFNTSWVSWSINKNITTSTESASATFNFKINNTTTSINNSHLNVSKNLSSTISNIQYSKDNATWQDSNVFSSLTPNTTYTLYVKAIAKSATGETATGYGSVSGTTSGNPPSYTATAGSITRAGFTVTPSSITYETGASFSSFKVEWGTSTAYSTGSNTNTTSAAAYTVSNLTANTTYYWRTTLTDNQGHSTQKTGSITTTGNAPTVTASTTPARTSCTLAIGATYDTNASFSSGKYEYGTSTSYGTSVNISAVGNQTISNLTPNTTYYYKVSITDNKSRTGTKTGTFLTTCNAPSNVTITRSSSTTTSITVTVSATGDTNAPITKYLVGYKLPSESIYTGVDIGTNTSTTISNLNVDTDYDFYVAATNARGTTLSSTATYSTLLTNPSLTAITPSSITANSCVITATASISPSRTLSYRFSKDSGSTWTSYQSSNSYTWTNLTESTTYLMTVQVKATHVGTNASDTVVWNQIAVTTLSGQAKLSVKVNGAWKNGPAYIKVRGAWKEAKTVYVKVNGAWKEQV